MNANASPVNCYSRPGSDTWHGFERRRILGLRRSLMLNYVGAEWRARQELCFPDRAVK